MIVIRAKTIHGRYVPKRSRSPSAVGYTPIRAELLNRAVQALQIRQFAEAERLAAEFLNASRTDKTAIAVLAHALIAQGRGREAIAPLEKAVRRGSDPRIETLLGAALGGAGRSIEAIEQLRQTIKWRPPHLPAFQELAGQLAKAEQLDDAIAVIERAIALMPHFVDLQLDMAQLHLRRNARGAARAILEKARDATSGRPDILTALARVLLLDGEYAKAADTFRHALAHFPEDAVTLADLAACLFEMDQRETGESVLRAAYRGRPQMFGRAVYALTMASHGRFFFRPSAAAKFLSEKT